MNPTASNGAESGFRGVEFVFLLLVLLAALGLRTYELGARPMHADEANQAVKLGQMLEGAAYVFDPHDHHGPTLYFFGLIPAKLRGEGTLAQLTETSVRLTPVVAGVIAVGLLWWLVRPWGRWPALIAALLLTMSPAAVYYSRYFIQETLLVTFTLGAWVFGRKAWQTGGIKWAVLTGGCVGLMLATKASALIYLVAALIALGVCRPPTTERRQGWCGFFVAAGAALAVAALFYSSFGRNLTGLRDAMMTPWMMLGRVSAGVSGHEKPWWYYANLFVYQRNGGYLWDQSVFVLAALVGGVMAWRRPGIPRFIAVYTLVIFGVLSATPYKTPWQVVNVIPGLCVLAALTLTRWRWWVSSLLVLTVVGNLWWQTRRAVFQRPADSRNPLAYVHAVPDMKKVPAIAASAPRGLVKVISAEYWPLPWYLRQRPETGYWAEAPVDCDGALVFAGMDQAEEVRSRLRGKYRESFIGLRPGVLLIVFTRIEG